MGKDSIQVVNVPMPLDHFGFNFKCDACSCEFHLNKYGYLSHSKIPLIDVDIPGNEKIIKCPNWHCEARIRLVTIDKNRPRLEQ